MEVVKYLFRTAISLLLFAYPPLSLSSQDDLGKAFAGFDRLEMDFTQEVYDHLANLIEVSFGKCRVSKPSISWRTIQPFEQTILLSKDTLKIFDPDLEQLIVKKIDPSTDNIPLNFLLKKNADFENFVVTELASDSPSNRVYSLSPVSQQLVYSRIEIETRDNVFKVIKIFGLSGEETRIELSNSRSLSDEDLILILDVPEGIDIVDG